MANIYEFLSGFLALWSLIEDETVDDSVIEDCFTNMKDDFSFKMENCCKYIKNTEAVIAGLKEEIKRLQEKVKHLENSITRLKALMYKAQKASGEKKLSCGTFTTSIQNNPPSCVIDCDLAGIPSKYLIPQDPKVDKKAMLEDLKADDNILKGVAHIEQGESLRIR